MFKKNTPITGFVIGKFIKTNDGSEVTTGTPTCKRMLDGTGGVLTNAAYYDAISGLWKINLTAADMNGDLIGLAFTLTNCQPITFTIKTVVNNADDIYSRLYAVAEVVDEIEYFTTEVIPATLATMDERLIAVKAKTDNLPGSPAASSEVSNVLSAVQNVQNNTFIAANIPGLLQVPASGDPQTVTITLAISDETGAAHDIDSSSNPAVVLINNAGTDRTPRLSTWQHPATGKYTAAYTNTAGDAIENLYWEVTATVNGKLRRYVAATQLVNTIAIDFTATDRQTLSGIAAQIGTAGSGLTAVGDSRLGNLDAAVSLVKAKTDNLPDDPASATTVSAIKTKTDKIPDNPAAVGSAMILTAAYDAAMTAAKVGDAMTLQPAERDAIAAALLDLANAVDGKTPRQALQIITAVLAGKVSGAGSGTETFRSLDDQHNRVVVTADVSGNRTNVTYQ